MANNKFLYRFALTIVFLFFGAGCSASTESNTREVVPETVPSSTIAVPTDAYPPPAATSSQAEAYPAPDAFNENAVLLALDKPILPGDTVVTGVGPPSLTVYLLNITFMGEELGAGTIGKTGTFIINVAEIPSGIRIGLTADIATIGLTEEDIRPGDETLGVPQVGFFYDSYVIRE